MKFICAHCGNESERATGEVNRARKKGLPLYCDTTCFGLAHRSGKSVEQKKREKSEYDKEYRAKNLERIKRKKREHFQKTYDREKAAVERKKNMARHVEYCRQPTYKAKKKAYDRQYKAKQRYGEFWESAILIQDIEQVVDTREAYRINRLFEKATTRRKRQWRQKNLRLKI